MEPDVIHMCSSSSPPHLDEEDGDDFGGFGDFARVPSLTIPPRPPGLLSNGAAAFPHLSFGGLAGDPGNAVSKSHRGKLRDVSCGFSLSHPSAAAPEVDGCWREGESPSWDDGPLLTNVLINGFEDEQRSVPPAVEPGREWRPHVDVGSSARSGALSRTSSPRGADRNAGCRPAAEEAEALSNGCWDERERHRVGGGLSPGTGAEERSPVGGAERGRGGVSQNSGFVRTVSASTSGDFASFCQAVSPDGLEDFGELGFGFGAVAADDEKLGSGDDSADFGAGSSGGREGDSDPFPSSDSFADFRSAPADPDAAPEWDPFGGQAGGGSWAAFQSERSATCSGEGEERQRDGPGASPPRGSSCTCRRNSVPLSLCSRLESLFQTSFPVEPIAEAQEEVFSLWAALNGRGQEQGVSGHRTPQDIWRQLQDIHGALGLKHRWAGSHSNKALLRSLGVDSRNILFASQRSHLAAVSSHATDLGMIQRPPPEAEKINSVAQRPSGSPEISTSCPESKQQGAPPPVRFDCGDSGRTDPVDGTSLRHAACAARSRQSPVA
ncbi:aftiphilin-like [Scleropages formosus]|uniref:Aftiphilin-like n=1 Tax=Scleropages formosus TaxID=113540 RepID=A0A8C9TNL8_SCLFO|nr:aftiphilin-like [Scleropages formosus]